MEEVKKEAAEFMKVRAVWQFFEAEAAGDSLQLFGPGESESVHTFRFPRQRQGDFLCLSDYVLPAQNGRRDHVALFVVTAGGRTSSRAREGGNDGIFFNAHRPHTLPNERA